MNKLKDSGLRTTFDTGSQKEVVAGRGRYDLVPLQALSLFISTTNRNNDKQIYALANLLDQMHEALIIESVHSKIIHLSNAIAIFVDSGQHEDLKIPMLVYVQQLAVLYEAGANKYAARDWEKGRPMSIFVNSALRHLFQYLLRADDEDHGTAFIWNVLSCIDTIRRMSSMSYVLNEVKD